MSVIKAILFYSKHDLKSLKMKKVIDNVGADIETVSVDSQEVRDRLLEDDKFGIDQVPAVLVLYASGQHKTYTGNSLDQWFNQLLENIQNYQMQQQQQMMAAQAPPPQPDPEPYHQIEQGIPKPLRKKPSSSTSQIPTSLPSPGKPPRTSSGSSGSTTLIDFEEEPGSGIAGSGMSEVSGMGGISDAQASMITQHIKDSEPLIPIGNDPNIQPQRKEVKKEGLSAAELAKKMAEQREQYEEKLDENRPFI